MLKCTTKSKTNETILPSAVTQKVENDGSGISGLNLPAISPKTIILNFLCITTVVLKSLMIFSNCLCLAAFGKIFNEDYELSVRDKVFSTLHLP